MSKTIEEIKADAKFKHFGEPGEPYLMYYEDVLEIIEEAYKAGKETTPINQSIEELKRNKCDIQGYPSPWFDEDEVDTLIDSAYNLGMTEGVEMGRSALEEAVKVTRNSAVQEERERIKEFFYETDNVQPIIDIMNKGLWVEEGSPENYIICNLGDTGYEILRSIPDLMADLTAPNAEGKKEEDWTVGAKEKIAKYFREVKPEQLQKDLEEAGLNFYKDFKPTAEVKEVCVWKYVGQPCDNSNYMIWVTGCGTDFDYFINSPEENHFNHCPYCGKPIKVEGKER